MECGLDLSRRDRRAQVAGGKNGAENESTPADGSGNDRLLGSAIAGASSARPAGKSKGRCRRGDQEVAASSSRRAIFHAGWQTVPAHGSALGSGEGGDAVAGSVGS